MAWHGSGHERIVEMAMDVAGTNLPPFFTQERDIIAHCSQDPDMFRYVQYPELPAQEGPEHFLDIEMLGSRDLPPTRPEYVTLCRDLGINPFECGFLPYAILEWAERLVVAFSEYRTNPGNRPAALKSAVYAGILAHYAADLEQPLHTTVHYDGKSQDGRSSPRTGIHGRVDAIAGKITADGFPAPQTEIRPYTNFQASILAEFRVSNRHVETVYRLESRIPPVSEPAVADDEVIAFVRERMTAASTFTANIFLTAWRESANTRIPPFRGMREQAPAPSADSETARAP